MTRVLAVARNTFREAVRDKIFALVGAFGLVLVLSSIVLSPLTIGAQTKMVADVGLSSITIFGLLIILLVGSGMVHKEIDKRTIFTMLSKPITRTDYMLGKYFGLMLTLLVIMASMTLLFLLSVWLTPTSFNFGLLKALYMAVCEMTVVTAVAMLFSSFTTATLTSLFTLGVFLVGHTLGDLETFTRMSGGVVGIWAMKVARIVLPNLELFNVRNAAVHGLPIHGAHLVWAGVYALLYSALCLSLGSWLFGRRDFK